MPDLKAVQAVVHDVLGSGGDETIIEYICGILEDEHFEFGEDGADLYEQVGPVMVDSGCVADDDAAQAACKQMADLLSGE
jgi:hypothetical protein